MKRMRFDGKDIEQFCELIIKTFFSGNIRKETSDQDRAGVYQEIKSLCLMRGVNMFIQDMEGDSSFIDVMENYARNTSSYMQMVGNKIYDLMEKEDATQEERRLYDFFEDRGFKPSPPIKERLREVLQKVAGDQDLSDFLLEALVEVANRSSAPESSGKRFSVICREHGKVSLSNEVYVQQMLAGNTWKCPICGINAELDEEEEGEDAECNCALCQSRRGDL